MNATFQPATAPVASSNGLYRRLWRWHFYAGLVCLPFLVSLAATGAMYLFRGGIEDMVYRKELLRSSASPDQLATVPAQQLIASALRAHPGQALAYTVPAGPARNAQVDVAVASGAVLQIFLDPATGKVAGSIDSAARLMTVVKHIHSLALIGNWARYLIEMVAGWTLVLSLTGIYLWWPRGRRGGVLSVRATPASRLWWRDVHAVTGILAVAIIGFLALTGMPWSAFWGSNMNRIMTEQGLGVPAAMWGSAPRSALPLTQAGDNVPWTLRGASLPRSAPPDPHAGHAGHAAMADMPGMAGMPGMPAMPGRPADAAATSATSAAPAPAVPDIGVDGAQRAFALLGLEANYRLALPQTADGVYTAVFVPDQVEAQRVVHLDRYSGRVLADLRYADFGNVAKVTEWGISVHKGLEYGLANQLLMLLGCLALLAMATSGAVMWWRRRPAGTLAAPPYRASDRIGPGVLALAVALGVCFPVLGASMLLALCIDCVAAPLMSRK